MTVGKRIASFGTAAVIAGALGLMPGALSANAASSGAATQAASAQTTASGLAAKGTVTDQATGMTKHTTATLSNLKATATSTGGMVLSGTISGKGIASPQQFTAPVTSAAVSNACNILTLNLGAIHLDLLGLVVDLSPVNLNVTAVPGAGNLLGNLLCAVAGLLDGGGLLSSIVNLLNQILAGLNLGGL